MQLPYLMDIAEKAGNKRASTQNPFKGTYKSTLPDTAADVKLFRQNLLPASYGDVPFGVVTIDMQAGRDIETTKLFEGDVTKQKSTNSPGAGSVRDVAAGRVSSGASLIDSRRARADALAASNAIIYVGMPSKETIQSWDDVLNSSLLPPGEHPLVRDNGQLPNKISIRAFIIDTTKDGTRTSYIANRDALLKKVSDPNPFMLQLPNYSAFPAVAGAMNIRWDTNKAGIEYADIVFYRATSDLVADEQIGDRTTTQANYEELKQQTINAIATAKLSALHRLQNQNGLLPYIRSTTMKTGVLSALNGVADNIGSLTSGIVDATNDVLATVDKYNRAIANISNEIDTLILFPARLSKHISDTYSTFVGAITSPVESYNYMMNTLDEFIDDMESTTLEGLDTLGLYDVSTKIEHISNAFGVVAKSSLDTSYTSLQEVLQNRDEITEVYTSAIHILARFPEHASILSAMSTLYSSLIDYLIQQQAYLPNTKQIVTTPNVPLIVTAYNIYGDSALVDDLERMNKIHDRLSPPIHLEVLAL